MVSDRDETFMRLALAAAEEAAASGEFPVGAVLVAGDEVVAEGRRSCSGGGTHAINELAHAEVTALRNLLRDGGSTEGVTVYSTLEPCLMCYSTLLVNGVRRIVYGCEDAMGGGTSLPLKQLNPLYREMEVEITGGVLWRESLALFQRFFSSPDCRYLADTLLARDLLARKI